jgi:hypothetical protein
MAKKLSIIIGDKVFDVLEKIKSKCNCDYSDVISVGIMLANAVLEAQEQGKSTVIKLDDGDYIIEKELKIVVNK